MVGGNCDKGDDGGKKPPPPASGKPPADGSSVAEGRMSRDGGGDGGSPKPPRLRRLVDYSSDEDENDDPESEGDLYNLEEEEDDVAVRPQQPASQETWAYADLFKDLLGVDGSASLAAPLGHKGKGPNLLEDDEFPNSEIPDEQLFKTLSNAAMAEQSTGMRAPAGSLGSSTPIPRKEQSTRTGMRAAEASSGSRAPIIPRRAGGNPTRRGSGGWFINPGGVPPLDDDFMRNAARTFRLRGYKSAAAAAAVAKAALKPDDGYCLSCAEAGAVTSFFRQASVTHTCLCAECFDRLKGEPIVTPCNICETELRRKMGRIVAAGGNVSMTGRELVDQVGAMAPGPEVVAPAAGDGVGVMAPGPEVVAPAAGDGTPTAMTVDAQVVDTMPKCMICQSARAQANLSYHSFDDDHSCLCFNCAMWSVLQDPAPVPSCLTCKERQEAMHMDPNPPSVPVPLFFCMVCYATETRLYQKDGMCICGPCATGVLQNPTQAPWPVPNSAPPSYSDLLSNVGPSGTKVTNPSASGNFWDERLMAPGIRLNSQGPSFSDPRFIGIRNDHGPSGMVPQPTPAKICTLCGTASATTNLYNQVDHFCLCPRCALEVCQQPTLAPCPECRQVAINRQNNIFL